ncbi:uncharacterized protein [Spinacia oleracea]|uniref:Transposase-associated domain-containing protein n=1 Tax=Spinacia oleracea TaxID=3562 RepID=A0ABM3QY39_SPIOL|nr:uncharacterized protein LOC130463239 [Spinacia oleracea]
MDISDPLKKRLEWMSCDDRTHTLYINGVKEFLDFAFTDLPTGSEIEEEETKVPCPCNRCNNSRHKTREDIFEDLLLNGIVKGYVRWIYHGEYKPPEKRCRVETGDKGRDEIFEMIFDAHEPMSSYDVLDEEVDNHPEHNDIKGLGAFERLLRDAQQRLYSGCDDYSKLLFILEMFQIKCMEGITNKAFTKMLKMYKRVLPKDANVPSTYREARKMVTDLGFDYEKIEACENDCMFFWKESANLEKCSVCDTKRNKTSPKVLRYFPLTPRLQRLFMSRKTANDMRWHKDKRDDDGILRHPADSKAWKHFDESYSSFALESRNVRLGLASDGFNPFGGLRSDYSIWPVVIVVYNLPPWMCMKQPYTMLSLLIPGKSAPGINIDVYLKPLVEELKQLWEFGAKTYDASKNEYFDMHAALLWTINDFPAYANLSGWSTKGYKACPCCMNETSSTRLPNCRKCCYMDHRRFLHVDHKWRNSKSFNGKVERRSRPKKLSGNEILEQVKDLEGMKFGKTFKLPKRKDNWKKKSIFFDFPYWSSLLIRHNLDVMHIEKNVCDNILGTLLDIEGKSKDHIKARHYLKHVNIMKHLAPKLVDGKWHIPAAPYTLSKSQKLAVCKYLEDIKVPDGYSSNFSKCINLDKRKIWGLKTHDCHVLLEELLPLAIRGVSSAKVYEVVTKLSEFFKNLCSKSLKLKDLNDLENHIAITLCEMEKNFLPSFFDVMVHLCVHLAEEAKLAGPVHYRWMYPIERYSSALLSH